MTDEKPFSADFGRELYDQVARENRLQEEAELESWYHDYHHWNHYDAADRSSAGLRVLSYAQYPNSIWFRLFRWALGLPATPSATSQENPYRSYRYFPNDSDK
jgi:hypothetical protein